MSPRKRLPFRRPHAHLRGDSHAFNGFRNKAVEVFGRNVEVDDVFEPGAVFKNVAAALFWMGGCLKG